jgi:hypothetical protein
VKIGRFAALVDGFQEHLLHTVLALVNVDDIISFCTDTIRALEQNTASIPRPQGTPSLGQVWSDSFNMTLAACPYLDTMLPQVVCKDITFNLTEQIVTSQWTSFVSEASELVDTTDAAFDQLARLIDHADQAVAQLCEAGSVPAADVPSVDIELDAMLMPTDAGCLQDQARNLFLSLLVDDNFQSLRPKFLPSHTVFDTLDDIIAFRCACLT